MIIVGLVVPRIILWVKIKNHLDISHDVGVIPWLVLTLAGIIILGWSFVPETQD